MYSAFALEVRLASPLIRQSSSHLTLDSLLAAAIYKNTGSVDTAHTDIPLKLVGDLWASSNCFTIEPRKSSECFISALNLHYGDYDLDTRKNNILRTGGYDQPKMDVYTSYETERLIWFGYGDPDQCLALIQSLDGIGKKISHGFGLIDSSSAYNISVDRSFVLPDGSPARPIPVQIWDDISRSSKSLKQSHQLPVDLVGYKPAYWNTQQFKLCVLPTVPSLSKQQLQSIESGVDAPELRPLNIETPNYINGIQFFHKYAFPLIQSRVNARNFTKLSSQCSACGSTIDLQRTGSGYTTLCGVCSSFGGGYQGISRPGRMGAGWMGIVTTEDARLVSSKALSPPPFDNLPNVKIETGKEALSVFIRDQLLSLPEPPFLFFVSGNSTVNVINNLKVSWSHRQVHISGSTNWMIDAVRFNDLYNEWLDLDLPVKSIREAVLYRENAKLAYSDTLRELEVNKLKTLFKKYESLEYYLMKIPSKLSDDWEVFSRAIQLAETEMKILKTATDRD